MSLPWSPELNRVVHGADEDARRQGQPLTTAHLLIALHAVPSEARALLEQQVADGACFSQALRYVSAESHGVLARVYERAAQVAEGAREPVITPLHLLYALSREYRCQARELLQMTGLDLEAVREMTLSTVSTTSARARSAGSSGTVESVTRAPRADLGRSGLARRDHSPRPIGLHPALSGAGEGLFSEEDEAFVDEDDNEVRWDEVAWSPGLTREAGEPLAPRWRGEEAATPLYTGPGGSGGAAPLYTSAGAAGGAAPLYTSPTPSSGAASLPGVGRPEATGLEGMARPTSSPYLPPVVPQAPGLQPGHAAGGVQPGWYAPQAGHGQPTPPHGTHAPAWRGAYAPPQPDSDEWLERAETAEMEAIDWTGSYTPAPPDPFETRPSMPALRQEPPRSAISQKPRLNLPPEFRQRNRSGLRQRLEAERAARRPQQDEPDADDRSRKGPPERRRAGGRIQRGQRPSSSSAPEAASPTRPQPGDARPDKPGARNSGRSGLRGSLGIQPKGSASRGVQPRGAQPGGGQAKGGGGQAKGGGGQAKGGGGQAKGGGEREAAEHRRVRESQEIAARRLAQRLFGDREPGTKRAEQGAGRAALDAGFDRFNLNPQTFPTLTQFGRNLLVEARDNRTDPVIGREREIELLTDVLNKRRSNNPVLIGPAGVGKTAIVEGLARLMIEDDPPAGLGERVIIALDHGALLCGTQLRGSFQERIGALKKEVRKASGRVILFLDELHVWLGGGNGEGSADIASELKVALARGELPCIGATTPEELRRFVEADPAFKRRFDTIEIEPPDADTSVRIIQGVIDRYASHHSVRYAREAIDAAVRFSDRYIPERQQPDKALGVLDRAGAFARRTSVDEVGREQVARVVSEIARVPAERLLMSDRDRFLRMEEHLAANLIGHRHVIERVARVIRRNYAGFASHRPIGSFLFLGPTGVGKTEMVKVLAEFMFGSREAIVRLDMSEFMEKHAVSRLLGAPPGYVGYEEGGQLTEALRRQPYQIVLLDEVEKAHPEVLNVLLQLLDEGKISDGQGRGVDFSNTVVVLTSNLGAEHFQAGRRGAIGFSNPQQPDAPRGRDGLAGAVLESGAQAFPAELWNRIEERLVFQSLTREDVAQIASLQLKDSARRLESERGIRLEYDEALIALLIERGGYDPLLGARPMRQTIQRLVEAAVAEAILREHVEPGRGARVTVQDDEVCVEPL